MFYDTAQQQEVAVKLEQYFLTGVTIDGGMAVLLDAASSSTISPGGSVAPSLLCCTCWHAIRAARPWQRHGQAPLRSPAAIPGDHVPCPLTLQDTPVPGP